MTKSASRQELEVATRELLGDLKLVDGATEKDFVFVALATCAEAHRAGRFPGVSVPSMMLEAFRSQIHPSITTEPGRSTRRVLELAAHFDQNGLIDRSSDAESFLTPAGVEHLGSLMAGPELVPEEV